MNMPYNLAKSTSTIRLRRTDPARRKRRHARRGNVCAILFISLQVIHMLILIMTVFFLCWTPILTYNLLAAFEMLGSGNSGTGSTKHIKTTFSLCSYLNSCLNPIIYGFMSKTFRNSFKTSISSCKWFSKSQRSPLNP